MSIIILTIAIDITTLKQLFLHIKSNMHISPLRSNTTITSTLSISQHSFKVANEEGVKVERYITYNGEQGDRPPFT
jgi:hypothetical protein